MLSNIFSAIITIILIIAIIKIIIYTYNFYKTEKVLTDYEDSCFSKEIFKKREIYHADFLRVVITNIAEQQTGFIITDCFYEIKDNLVIIYLNEKEINGIDHYNIFFETSFFFNYKEGFPVHEIDKYMFMRLLKKENMKFCYIEQVDYNGNKVNYTVQVATSLCEIANKTSFEELKKKNY